MLLPSSAHFAMSASSSTGTSSTASASASSTTTITASASVDPSTIATYSTWSEHQTRTKKSDTLIPFPIFSAYWLPISLHPPTATPASHAGTVVFGGGGGKAGTGVASGLVVCDALLTGQRATPIELSPVGFLSTHDTIVMHTLPHPLFSELALAVGDGTAVCHINHSSHIIQPLSHTPTDYATRDPSSQSQAFSPSGELLATGGEDRIVRVWRYRDMRLLGVCGSEAERHKDMILSLDFNADGTLLASCAGDAKVQVWDTAALMRRVAKDGEGEGDDEKGREVKDVVVPLLASVTVVAEKGQNVKFQVCKFVGGTRIPLAKVERANEREGESEREEKTDGLRQRGAATAAQRRQQLASAATDSSATSSSSSAAIFPEQLLAVCNLTSRTNPSNRLIAVAVPNRPPPPSASISSSTSTSATSASTSPVTFPLLRSIVCSKHQLTQMNVSPNTRYLAVADNDGSVLLFHPLTFRPMYRSLQCHGLPATALCFTADSGHLLSASADKTFRFFDMAVVGGGGARGGGCWVWGVLVVWLLVVLMALVLAAGMGFMSGSDDKGRAGGAVGWRWRDVEDVLDVIGLWLTGTRSQARMNARRVG